MKIAVLSGKGGTGKTFLSVNLSSVMAHSVYVDCDVEEPNGDLFFKPNIEEEKKVTVKIPEFNKDKCTGCKACIEFCAFHACAFVKGRPLLFPEVCHSCGGCKLVCKYDAVTEVEKQVGTIRIGSSKQVIFLSGIMSVGQVSGTPIIKQLLANIPENMDTVIDCPPGSGCMVMESIQDADYCVIVAEPTKFGEHNLAMVYELTQVFHKKVGVVLNKSMGEVNPSEEYCRANNIEIIGKIPYDNEIGEDNSKGVIVVNTKEKARKIFEDILLTIRKKVSQ